MRVIFSGAAGEVTGSKHLLEVNGKRILLDCGLFQGSRKLSEDKNRNLNFDPKSIDMVVLSHAHMDHCGALPYLVKKGFSGPIITTSATADLCTYMLQDSAYIQEREVEFMRKENLGEPIEPLYTFEDALHALNLLVEVNYHKRFELCDGVHLTFFDAGHILGSSLVFLEIDDKEDGQKKTLTFTGDLGRKGMPILRDPEYITKTDYLIMECTYGNRFHKFVDDIDDQLEKLIKDTVKKGGKIIIPAFALERTQELVYHLNLLSQAKRIPDIPIYVDSPLAVNVTDVFKKHKECFDEKIYDEFLHQSDNPFGFGKLKYITDVEDSKALNFRKDPMIIISASGMMEHGRILHHLRNNIENPSTVVLVVGYQAENTLGRKLVEGEREVRIFGQTTQVRAKIVILDAFSAHADRSDLLDFVAHISDLKKIFLVHGEAEEGLTFADVLVQAGIKSEIETPKPKDTFQL
jgi:metallo-beta-lactamase family protein